MQKNQEKNSVENINQKSPEPLDRLKDYVHNDQGQAMDNEELFQEIWKLASKEEDTAYLAAYSDEDIKKLLENGYASINMMLAVKDAVRTKHEIYLGRLCNILRVRLKGQKTTFKEYVKTNIQIPQSTIQRYMRIADIRDAEQFAYLGTERLFFIVSSMKSIEFGGDLQMFVDEFNVTFNPEEEQTISEFKTIVRRAIFEKLSADNGWNLTTDQIESLSKRHDIDLGYFYTNAKTVINASGNVSVFASIAITDPEQGRECISKLNKAIKTASDLSMAAISDNKFFDKLDISEINKLENVLKQLQERAKSA
jgi:hypothetical protein